MPGPNDRLPIYRLTRPTVDDRFAHEVARRTMKLDQYTTKKSANGARIQLRSGTRVVDVHAASGGVWAADEAQLWNPELTPKLPEAARAKEIAAKYLADVELIPKGGTHAPFELAFDSIGGTFAAFEDVNTKKRTQRQLDVQVNYAIHMKDPSKSGATIPVVGGGGKVKVTLGDGGHAIGYTGTWRPITGVASEAKVIPKPEADALFEKRFPGLKLEKYESFLAYYAAPPGEEQEFLYPVYVYRSIARVGKQIVPLRMVTIPATTFGPPPKEQLRLPKRTKQHASVPALIPNPGIDGDKIPARRGIRTSNPFECGTSWIGASGGLAGSQNNAKGFVDGLAADGWNVNFNWGDANAWESDWRSSDDRWVDAADFVFYTGHASMNGWVLSTPNDSFLHFNEVGTMPSSPGDLWGQQDLEWMVIAACGPLQDDAIIPGGGNVFDRWRGVFDGLHLMLGYGGITFDNEEEGKTIIDYATDGMTLINAWFRTAQEIQPSTNGAAAPDGPNIYVGAMYAYNSGTTSPLNDHLWGHGSVAPDPVTPNVRVCMWTQT